MNNRGFTWHSVLPIASFLLIFIMMTVLLVFFLSELFGRSSYEFLKDHGSFIGAVLGGIVLAVTVFFTINAQKSIQEDIRLNDKKEAFARALVEVEDQFERAYVETIEALAHFLTGEQRKRISESSEPDDLKATMQNIHFKDYAPQDVEAIIFSKIQSITRMRTFHSDTLNKLYFQMLEYDELKNKKNKMTNILMEMFNCMGSEGFFERFIKQYVIFNEYTEQKKNLVHKIAETKKLKN